MFSQKVKGKTKLGENQTQMFLPHGNETFWYCQNKTRKLKQSVLILSSQNQHVSFKMFGFQSDCIFLWGEKPTTFVWGVFHWLLCSIYYKNLVAGLEGWLGSNVPSD